MQMHAGHENPHNHFPPSLCHTPALKNGWENYLRHFSMSFRSSLPSAALHASNQVQHSGECCLHVALAQWLASDLHMWNEPTWGCGLVSAPVKHFQTSNKREAEFSEEEVKERKGVSEREESKGVREKERRWQTHLESERVSEERKWGRWIERQRMRDERETRLICLCFCFWPLWYCRISSISHVWKWIFPLLVSLSSSPSLPHLLYPSCLFPISAQWIKFLFLFWCFCDIRLKSLILCSACLPDSISIFSSWN